MLAETACRRSSWLRSLVSAQRLSRPLQVQASAHEAEDEQRNGNGRNRRLASRAHPNPKTLTLRGPTQHRSKTNSLNEHLLEALGEAPNAVGAKEEQQQSEEKHLVGLSTSAEAGKFPALVDTLRPAPEDAQRARASLQKMARELADPRAASVRESRYQTAVRQLKAATGKLDRMLVKMQKQKDFKQVEAVAYLYEEVFPQFAGQKRHWRVICEHYALALNYQQRFQEVIDKFSPSFEIKRDGDLDAGRSSLLSPRLAESIFVAHGHLREAGMALELLDTLQRHGVLVTKIAYFHVLNAMLRDERFTDFEKVMELCEEIVTKLPGENVPLSLLPMIMATAAARGEGERAMKFYNHPPNLRLGPYTEYYFEICLQQLNSMGENGVLMEMYRNLMESSGASRTLKERVSKYLLRKKVEHVTADTRNKQLNYACQILEIMNHHKISASHHAIFPLLRALLIDPVANDDDTTEEGRNDPGQMESAEDLRNFFARYSAALEWNAFSLCEAVVAGVRTHRADLVDDLFVYALDNGVPIKYAALEQAVVFYSRMGLIPDLERVADMVRALRLNKYIPVGMAVTELGMAANLRLHRYEEVAVLFEDFASRDGERRRILWRRFMLKSALTAYKRLGRSDEALAVKTLLHQSYGNLLEGRSFDEELEEDAKTGGGAENEDEAERNDEIAATKVEVGNVDSGQPGEADLPSMGRFTSSHL